MTEAKKIVFTPEDIDKMEIRSFVNEGLKDVRDNFMKALKTILLILLPVLFLLTACGVSEDDGGASLDESQAMDVLSEAIGMVEGAAIVSYGQEDIDGGLCWTFAYGRNTEEKFTAEEHYAVTMDGKVLKMDIADGRYKEYGDYQ